MRRQLAYPGETLPFIGEIACWQLCGLGHYRMRGYYTIETRAEYDA
jgi:hypothetical protein